jgi:hypothetical protein
MFDPNGLNVGRGGIYDTATVNMLVNHTYKSQNDSLADIATTGYFPDYFGSNPDDPEVVIGDIIEAYSVVDAATAFYQVAFPAPMTLVLLASVTGNVSGPGSSTDNAVARFDGTTGTLLQNSPVIIDDSGNISGVVNIAADSGAFSSDISVTDIEIGGSIVMPFLSIDVAGNILTAGTITDSNLTTGVVHSDINGLFTSSAIVNADVDAAAAIVDTKLDTIATAGKVSNSATTATDANTASAIVARDASGDFIAGKITTATGVVFPTTGGTPGTLADYEVGSFSIVWTGALTNTVTAQFVRVGKQVTIVLADNTASTAAAAGLVAATSTIPARILPAYDVNQLCTGKDNGTEGPVTLEVFTNGAVKVGNGYLSTASFTNAAVGGYFASSITYISS